MSAAGMTVGNHTLSHPNMASLGEQDQREEIAGAWEALRGRPGVVASLALPFGYSNEVSERAAAAARCESVMGGAGVNRPLDLRRVSRVALSSGGPATLFALAEVVEPIKAKLVQLFRLRRPAWQRVPT
jgi:peptidoglycan/xylan/chitin deacetylase (PgdA/CDA1 family)